MFESGYADFAKFKVSLLDCGLLGAALNISSDIIITGDRFFSEYNGAFIENFVASELVTTGTKELYYWTSKSDAEVDFINIPLYGAFLLAGRNILVQIHND